MSQFQASLFIYVHFSVPPNTKLILSFAKSSRDISQLSFLFLLTSLKLNLCMKLFAAPLMFRFVCASKQENFQVYERKNLSFLISLALFPLCRVRSSRRMAELRNKLQGNTRKSYINCVSSLIPSYNVIHYERELISSALAKQDTKKLRTNEKTFFMNFPATRLRGATEKQYFY